MSWLARSIANTLLIDGDDDPHPASSSSNANHDHSQFVKGRQQIQAWEIEDQDRNGGVKEDLSEFTESLTRQLRGVAFFLAPSPPPPVHRYSTTTPHPDPSVPHDDPASNSAYDDLRFGVGYDNSNSLTSPTSEQVQNIEAVGVTDEALAFARNISHHPETWLDFPLSEEEDDDDFEMSDTQWNHVTLVERLAPRLAALRIELCPIHMSESYFWKVYFVLLHSRLNKHDADLLSTPQIVAARTMWMKELQKRTGLSNSVHEDFSVDLEPKYPITRSDKAVSEAQEEGITSWTSLDQRTACSYTTPIDDDDDDWVHENLELNGYVGPDVHIGSDEDISFSDLEADDDCPMPIRSKIL